MVDFISSFQESLNIAFSFDPVLVISFILRAFLIGGIALVFIKWLGSKGVGQLTTYQLIIVVSLGTIIGEPMINTDAQIPNMIVVAIIIIIIFKTLDYVSAKNKKMEKIMNPDVVSLVKDGIVDKEGLTKARIGIKEFESFMRLAGIKDIKQVEISNLEINGQISFIRKN